MQQFSTLTDLAITAAAIAQSDSAGRLIMDAEPCTLHEFTGALDELAKQYEQKAEKSTGKAKVRAETLAAQLRAITGVITIAGLMKLLDDARETFAQDLETFERTPERMRSPLEIIKASELLEDE